MAQSTVQWGGRHPKDGGRVLDGRTWDASPLRHVAQAL
jgi:protein gp37